MKFIDLFAGIGGFRYGLERNNKSKAKKKGQESGTAENDSTNSISKYVERTTFSCVYSNEWDKYAAQIYKRHYGEIDTRDITTIKANEIPDFDLLCAGFPCQAFSIAGKRLGFNDTRGTLFFEIARILKHKRPRYFLLENVKGLLSHDKGKTFQTILRVLSDLGYEYQWQVLNSKNFGVPQNRERVFIVGHLRGESRPKVFPIGKNDKVYSEKNSSQSTYLKSPLRGQGDKPMIIDTQIRRLTPIECERLQGFPDGWTKGVSDTQRYKCLGNAVTTNVVTEIGKRLNA